MYTYNISRNLCEIFNTEFDPTHLPSDQELMKIPEDYSTKWNFTNKGGTISEEHKEAVRKGRTGCEDSEETKLKKSKARMGSLNPMYGVHRFGESSPMFGKTHSQEIRNKISESTKNWQTFFCDCCGKNIKGKQNWDRHLQSSRHLSQSNHN
jgi:hypothetical protein